MRQIRGEIEADVQTNEGTHEASSITPRSSDKLIIENRSKLVLACVKRNIY
jgi:hypothetical protein